MSSSSNNPSGKKPKSKDTLNRSNAVRVPEGGRPSDKRKALDKAADAMQSRDLLARAGGPKTDEMRSNINFSYDFEPGPGAIEASGAAKDPKGKKREKDPTK